MTNRCGVHLRLNSSLLALAERAVALQVSFFQCFFVIPATGKLVTLSAEEKAAFVSLRRSYFNNLYLHGSYWINLASTYNNGYRAFEREIRLAKELEFTHIVIHPGSANGSTRRIDGIDVLAKSLNRWLAKEHTVQLLLENTAHGNMSVGSSLEDFTLLLTKIDKPERIGFCIDTAHAYSFGYNIADLKKQNEFIELLQKTIGIDKVKLIHVNDTRESLGSKIDKHVIPGQGNIGKEALKQFINDPRLAHIPIVSELLFNSEQQEEAFMEMFKSWAV